MPGNSFGQLFRITTWGESHGAGIGVVIDGSVTVLINGLPACRAGDTIIEALGPPNKIVMGLPTVIIGG